MENSSSSVGWSVTGSICERAAAPVEPPVVWVRHAVLGGGRVVEGAGDGVVRGVLAVRIGAGRYQVAGSDLVLGEGDTVVSSEPVAVVPTRVLDGLRDSVGSADLLVWVGRALGAVERMQVAPLDVEEADR